MGPVAGQHVELHEAAGVEQHLEALPGGELAPGVLALDGLRVAGVERRLLELAQLLDPLPQRMGHGIRPGPAPSSPSSAPASACSWISDSSMAMATQASGSLPARPDAAGLVGPYFWVVTIESFTPRAFDAWFIWGTIRVMPIVPKSTPFSS